MRILHVALYAYRFEETILFYKEVFNAEELMRFKTTRNACWLKIGESVLEIFESEKLENGLFKHIAIETDDINETYAKALEHGAKAYVIPKDVMLNNLKIKIAFVKGLNEEEIELVSKEK